MEAIRTDSTRKTGPGGRGGEKQYYIPGGTAEIGA